MFDKKCIKDRFIFSLLNPITEGTENGYILLILLVELLQMPNCIKLCSNNNVVSIISSSFIEGEWLFIQTVLLLIQIFKQGIKILLFLILSNNNGDINFIKPSLNHLIKLLSKSLIKKQNSVDQSQIVEESNNNLPSQDILYAYRPYLFQIFHYLCNNHNQLKTLILKQNFVDIFNFVFYLLLFLLYRIMIHFILNYQVKKYLTFNQFKRTSKCIFKYTIFKIKNNNIYNIKLIFFININIFVIFHNLDIKKECYE